MEQMRVKDLMVPIEEYATVSHDATLLEAVLALEHAQEKLDRMRYPYLHRAILVLDQDKKVVGKISQLDALRALEPQYEKMGDPTTLSRAGFSPKFLQTIMKQFSLLSDSLVNICGIAANRKVKSFMHTPGEGEYVEENASLPEAIHQFVMGHHQSLLVTRGKEILGILRLTDVFKAIFQIMKTCGR